MKECCFVLLCLYRYTGVDVGVVDGEEELMTESLSTTDWICFLSSFIIISRSSSSWKSLSRLLVYCMFIVYIPSTRMPYWYLLVTYQLPYTYRTGSIVNIQDVCICTRYKSYDRIRRTPSEWWMMNEWMMMLLCEWCIRTVDTYQVRATILDSWD